MKRIFILFKVNSPRSSTWKC